MADLMQQMPEPKLPQAPQLAQPESYIHAQPPMEMPAPETPDKGLFGAAYRQTNDFNAFMNLVTAPQFPVDPNFNAVERAKTSPYFNDYGLQLAKTRSNDEFNYVSLKIEQELKDKQYLATQGLKGQLVGAFAGLFTPTILIPFVGEAGGMKGVAEAGMNAMAMAMLQNGMIYGASQTDTPADFAIGVASGTVLGTLLGTAAVIVRPAAKVRALKDLEPSALGTINGVVHINEEGRLTEQSVIPHENKAFTAEQTRLIDSGKYTPEEVKTVDQVVSALEKEKGTFGEPPGAENMVRVYHSGSIGDGETGRWVSSNKTYASDYRPDLPLHYIDLPKEDVRINNPDIPEQGIKQGFTFNFELTPQEAQQLKMIERDTGALKANAAVIDEKIKSIKEGEPRGLSAQASSTEYAPMVPTIDEKTGELVYEPSYDVEADGVKRLGAMMPATGVKAVDRALAAVNPIARAANQFDQPIEAPGIRADVLRISTGGLNYEGMKLGLTAAPDGTVEDRALYWDGLLARALRHIEESYVNYIFGKGAYEKKSLRMVGALRQEFNVGAGKMPFEKYSETLAKALNSGDKSEVPEIQALAQLLRKDFYEEVAKAVQEAEDYVGNGKKLYLKLESKEDFSYMTRSFDPNVVRGQYTPFINLLADHFASAMHSFYSKRIEKVLAYAEDKGTLANILNLDAGEAKKLYDSLTETLNRTKEYTPEQKAIVDQIDHLEWEYNTVYDDILNHMIDSAEREELTDAEINVKMPEFQEKAKQIADQRKQVISAAMSELEKKAPPRIEMEKKEIAKLKHQRNAAAKAFGAMQAKQDALLEKILNNEELTLKNLRNHAEQWASLKKKAAQFSSQEWMAQLQKVRKQLDSAIALVQTSERKIAKLERQMVGGVEEADALLTKRIDRANSLFDKFEERLSQDPLDLQKAVQDRMEALTKKTADIIERRALRSEKLMKDAEGKYSPELAKAKQTALLDDIAARKQNLIDQIYKNGGEGIDETFSSMNFSKVAEDLATQIANRITGNSARLSLVDMLDAFDVGIRSPFKMRMLNLPYDEIAPYLNKNVEHMLRKYVNTIGSDTELFRAFGDRTGSVVMARLEKEMTAIKKLIETRKVDENGVEITPARRRKEMIAHDKAWKRREMEVAASIERIRNLRGIGDSRETLWNRLATNFMNLNALTMLGTAAVSSVSDMARPIFQVGFMNTFKDSWMPLIKTLVSESQREARKDLKKEFLLWSIGHDTITHRRTRHWVDDLGYRTNQTVGERMLEKASHTMPLVALYAPFTDATKDLAAAALLPKVLRTVEKFTEGKAKESDILFLSSIGINPDGAQRIQKQMLQQERKTRYNGVIIPNTDSWSDYGASRILAAAMAHLDSNTVVTPGLEKSLYLDGSTFGRVIGQFHTFTNSAQSKILLSGLQSRNMAAFRTLQGAVVSLACGVISYYLWANTHSEKARQEMLNASPEEWFDQALFRSGILGALSDVQAVMQRIPLTSRFATLSGMMNKDTVTSGKSANNISDQLFGSTYSTLETMFQIAGSIDNPTQGTIHQIRKLVPWNNVFYLKWAFNEVENGVKQYFPQRRN